MGAAPPPEKSQKTRVIALFQFHNANPDELVKSQKVVFRHSGEACPSESGEPEFSSFHP